MSDSDKQKSRSLVPEVVARSLVYFLPACVLLLVAVLVIYQRERVAEFHLNELRSLSTVQVQADIVRRKFRDVRNDARYLAEQQALHTFLTTGDNRDELLEEYLHFTKVNAQYCQVRLLDRLGKEVIRINATADSFEVVPISELQSKGDRDYFINAWSAKRGAVVFSSFDLNQEHGVVEVPWKPVVRASTPIFDANGERFGALVLNFLGQPLLDELRTISGQGISGTSGLVDGKGYYLEAATPEQSWGAQRGAEPTFITDHPEVWSLISSKTKGQESTARGLYSYQLVDSSEPSGHFPHLMAISFISESDLSAQSEKMMRTLAPLLASLPILFLVLALRLGGAVAVRVAAERKTLASKHQLRALSARLMDAQEVERRSLSRDLHDGLGQLLTAVSLQLQRAVRTGDSAAVEHSISKALEATSQALEQLHDISSRIRPSALDDLGLVDGVHTLVGQFEESCEIVAEFEVETDETEVPLQVASNVFRIVQEALTNVARHAGTHKALIHLRIQDEGLHLAVKDDGVGFHPDEQGARRLGIVGMRERTELLDGTFSLTSAPGRGTRIEVEIPLVAQEGLR